MKQIFNMLKQAHTMKREMGRISEDLARLEAEGLSAGGQVTVKMDGQMKIVSVTIEPRLLGRGDAAELGRLIVEAANQARERAQKLAASAMRKLAGDMPLPM